MIGFLLSFLVLLLVYGILLNHIKQEVSENEETLLLYEDAEWHYRP